MFCDLLIVCDLLLICVAGNDQIEISIAIDQDEKDVERVELLSLGFIRSVGNLIVVFDCFYEEAYIFMKKQR